MKKSKINKLFSGIFTLALAGILFLGAAACAPADGGNPNDPVDPNNPNDPGSEVQEVGIAIGDAPSVISKGTTVTLTVTVTGTTDTGYTWSVDNQDILTVSNTNVVSVLDDAVVMTDIVVTVTATANADTSKTASKAFTVRPAVEGQVDDLTAELIEEVSGYNITFEGTITDIYIDNENDVNSSTTVYNSKVMMDGIADGDDAGGTKWYGEWSMVPEFEEDLAGDVVTSNYRRGEAEQSSGKHPLLRQYINLQNELETVGETDYDSTPFYWDDNHLWNHFSGLGADITNKFTHDATNDVYRYNADLKPKENEEYTADALLLTYLAVSMTPLLTTEETFANVYLKIEDGHITTFYGTTVAQSNVDENGSVLQTRYSTVELAIKDVGKTVVPSPAPFEAPDHVDLLTQAISKMKSAKNYTFTSVQHDVSVAVPDEGEYESLSSVSTIANTAPAASVSGYYSHDAATGTVGVVGRVTDNIILLQNTTAYTSYDTNPYRIDYDGYRQYDGYFEEFTSHPVWGVEVDGERFKYLVGDRRITGDMFAKVTPQWDFSPNLFAYGGMNEELVGGRLVATYKFVLRDTSITADMAMQISMHDYAEDGAPASFKTLTIYVDGDGNVTKTEFPYDILGNYIGYITTTYSSFGSTTLDANRFTSEYYYPREYKDTWDKYSMRYYYPGHGNVQDNNYNCAQAMKEIFGADAYDLLPPPTVLMEIFGDVVYGPFYDYTTYYKDEDHTVVDKYVDVVSINTEFFRMDYPDNVDSNDRPVNIHEIIGKDSPLATKMAKYGFVYSANNSGWGTNGNYFGSYVNQTAGLIISFENNNTLNIFIEIHKIGDWTFDKR